MSSGPSPAALLDLEDQVQRALRRGEPEGLDILGYGEISVVLRLVTDDGEFACKRLPAFPDEPTLGRYHRTLEDYLDALSGRGVNPLPTTLSRVQGPGPQIQAYCVQPLRSSNALAPSVLARVDIPAGRALLERLVDVVLAAVDERVGLDAQLSNWIVEDSGALSYLDVTTPFLRDDAGYERLDLAVFLSSLPWVLRRPVKSFLLRSILGTYYAPRSTILDLAANLHKEQLGGWIPDLLAVANRRVTPDLTVSEVEAYYRDDARTWAVMQRVRQADRMWQRRVRRRPYPFLLPGKIKR